MIYRHRSCCDDVDVGIISLPGTRNHRALNNGTAVCGTLVLLETGGREKQRDVLMFMLFVSCSLQSYVEI